MILVAHFDLKLHQRNVKMAFLNGDIDETKYMVQLERFALGDAKQMICKLKKTIYSLKVYTKANTIPPSSKSPLPLLHLRPQFNTPHPPPNSKPNPNSNPPRSEAARMGNNADLESGGARGFDGMHRHQYDYPPHPTQPPRSERRWTAWLVPLFLVANVAMFVVVMYYNDCPSHPNRYLGKCVWEDHLKRFSFQPLRENPLYGPSSRTLKKLGALEWDRIVNQHQQWRLITCIWLHAGLIHLFVNMLSLILIGIPLEKQFGFIRIGIIYLLSGFGGSVLSSLFTRNTVSVGASGALFGLLGAILSELVTNWSLYSNKASTLLSLLVIIVVNLAVGLLPHIDNFAHIGGFLVGFFLGFVLLLRPQFAWMIQDNRPSGSSGSRIASKYKVYQLVLFVVAIALLIIGFAVALPMLFRGENGNDRCHWCHYLNCIPSSRWICSG